FVISPSPKNNTEKQMLDLIMNYKMDLGAGFERSWYQIYTSISICFTFLFLSFATVNWFFKKMNIGAGLWRGLLLIETILFGLVLLVTVTFTFLPPIICTGLIFLFALGSYLSAKTKS
ncbi:MAG: LIC_13387 family protein, partial [Sphingobacteriales bacterium]